MLKTPQYATLVQPNLEYFKTNSKNHQDLIKLETEITNINHATEDENTENPTKIVWSPMHKAVTKKKFGWWCFYKLLEGDAAALNGHDKSSIQIISEDIQRYFKLLDNCNSIADGLLICL